MDRKTRYELIDEHLEKYTGRKLNKKQICVLLDDALFILDDLSRMSDDVLARLEVEIS